MAKKQAEPQVAAAPTKELKTFTVVRVAGGWSMLTVTLAVDADGQTSVKDIVTTEPNIKAVTLEAFKIAAWKYWTTQ